MWYVYGEGGGEFTNLKDARKAAREFSTLGNEFDGYCDKPGEVNVWKDGTLFMTYDNGKLIYDGWTIKNYTYRVKNLLTMEEEEVVLTHSLDFDKVYSLSDGRRVQPLELLKTRDKDNDTKFQQHKLGELKLQLKEKEQQGNNNNGSEDGVVLEQMKQSHLLKESFQIHNKLNPNLFNSDGLMKDEVRVRLCEIADLFVLNIQEDEIPLKVYDYWLVGSNAAYNYSPESDIDVHIIVDMDMGVNPYLLRLLYDYIKSGFNDKYEIMVKGHEVELYLEDVKTSAVSNGVYSLKQAKWIKVPDKREEQTFNIEDSELYNIVYDKFSGLDDSEAEQFLDDLYIMRKESLTSDGEFGEGNLVFKEFRNKGYIDELKNMKYKYKSQELTLESLVENNKEIVDRISKRKMQTSLVNEYVLIAYDILFSDGNKSDMEMEVLKSDVINVESYMNEFSRAMHDRGIGFDIQDKQFYSDEECEVGEFTYFYLIIYRENWFDEE